MALKAWYKLDETTGATTAVDSSGNGYNGTVVGTKTFATGVSNNAIAITSGTQNWVIVPGANLNFPGDFSISLWIKSTGTNSGNNLYIIFKGVFGQSYNYSLVQDGSIDFNFAIYDGTSSVSKSMFLNLNDGKWHHFVCIRNSVSNVLRLFHNSVEYGTGVNTAGLGSIANPAHECGLGHREGQANANWTGLLDDVRFYDHVLTQAEITTLYTDIPLVYYKFDEATGTVANDSGSASIPGTLTNANASIMHVPGIKTNALAFDGVDDYVTATAVSATALNFERTDKFSFSYWIKTTQNTTGQGRYLISKYAPITGWIIQYDPSGYTYFELVSSGSSYIYTGTNATIANGQWRHIAITYDGSSNANGVNFYIDGALVTKTNINNTLTTSTVSNAGVFNIDALGNSVALFNGALDEIRIYKKELTQAEVTALFNDPFGPLLCWNYRANYKGSTRLFSVNGGGKFPSELKVPSSVDTSTGMMYDEGIAIDPSQYNVIQ